MSHDESPSYLKKLANLGVAGMPVAYANLVAYGMIKNEPFNRPGQDNCRDPFWLMREKFNAQGVILNTMDVNGMGPIAFELHVDVQTHKPFVPAFLFLWETTAICPDNASETLHSDYRLIFTWDDQLVDGCRYVKYRLPVLRHLSPFSIFGWNGRDSFCCVIAGNKTVNNGDKRELYSKRIETIRWFERHAPYAFDLYGNGWDRSPARLRRLNRLSDKLWLKVSPYLNGMFKRRPFPSYRGTVANKHETLLRYRFSICYENVSELSGYITEKIFDCFFAGCVPVYWGASNIYDYVPRECFVDRRQFDNHESLFAFLTSMTETDYIKYQQAIQTFLESYSAELFYAEAFASNIVNTILANLKEVE
jgi:hypothetical protein